ncbi:MAG: deoxyribose-phosphate aldolase [Candidatus Cloacimonetes bacterium]|nr:deoxyribose-phosphate aldolase [Candidatus Cloacimonadota bacterium]
MNIIKEIALKFIVPGEERQCMCGGAHEVCLRCKICRAESPDMTVTKVEDIARYIDHTNLKPQSTSETIVKLCEEAKSYNFKSVCVNPYFVRLCQSFLKKTNSLVCSVVGFPLGANISEVKGEETQQCIREGAKEIDMVNNIASVKEKDISTLLTDIGTVADVCRNKDAVLKVIIETCLLGEEEKIIACLAAKKAGSLFVKTSTGFSTAGATLEDVALMRRIVGPKFGVKASGGVSSAEIALKMIEAGANRIGTSNGVSIVEEFRK